MNIKEIKEMVVLMNENGLLELEIEKDGMRIRLKKTTSGIETSCLSPDVIEKPQIPAAVTSREIPKPAEKTAITTVEIKAPMVGTFYRAASPEAPPYVEIGQTIEPGQVVCIIEAMKLMNEIKSEIKGKIVEILTDNAEPVEFGQSMFILEPL